MIDLHCHLLPGIDDGPRSWDEAVLLASALVGDGVHLVAATPHGHDSPKARRYVVAELQVLVQELQQRLQAEAIPLQVVLGQELFLVPDLAGRLLRGEALSYAGSTSVLLESPNDKISDNLVRTIFELQVAGYRVLLAHPERIAEVQQDPNRLLPLVQKGVYVQVTASSLAGLHGKRLQATAEALLLSDMCHTLASDAHQAEGVRAPAMQRAFAAALALVGEARARALVEIIPHALLNNAPLPAPTPRPYRPRRRFKWLPF